MLVKEIMSTCTAECTEDVAIEKVYELMQKCEHGFAVVIDSEAHRVPIGVVTEHSICEQIIGRGRSPRGLSAGSVISPRIVKVDADSLVESVSQLVDGDSVDAIIAVNEKMQLCGILPKEKLPSANARTAAVPARQPTADIGIFGWIQ